MIDTNLTLIFWDTISGIIKNLPIFILIIWGVKTISKQMPGWIHQIMMEQIKIRNVNKALEFKT